MSENLAKDGFSDRLPFVPGTTPLVSAHAPAEPPPAATAPTEPAPPPFSPTGAPPPNYDPNILCDLHGPGWCGLPKGHRGHHRPPQKPAAPLPTAPVYATPTHFVPPQNPQPGTVGSPMQAPASSLAEPNDPPVGSPQAIAIGMSLVMATIEQFYQLKGDLILLNTVKPTFNRARYLFGIGPSFLR